MPFIGNKPSAVPLTSADITDGIITSAKIADGTIVNGDINASAAIAGTKISGSFGKVLQVVSSIIDETYANNSATFNEVTSHNLSITPSSASSKVLVFMNFNTRSSGTVNQFYTIFRGSTNVGTANGLSATHDDNPSSDTEVQMALQVLDSPSSTSAVNYKLMSKSDGSATARVNDKGSDSVITLMEIGA